MSSLDDKIINVASKVYGLNYAIGTGVEKTFNAVVGAGAAGVDFFQGLGGGQLGELTTDTQRQNQLRQATLEQDAARFIQGAETFLRGVPEDLRAVRQRITEGGRLAELGEAERQQRQPAREDLAERILVIAAGVGIVLGIIRAGLSITTTKVKIGWFAGITGAKFGWRLIRQSKPLQPIPAEGRRPFGLGQGFMETNNRFPTQWQNQEIVAVPDTPETRGGRSAVPPGEVEISREAMELIEVIQLQQWCNFVPSVCADVRLAGG